MSWNANNENMLKMKHLSLSDDISASFHQKYFEIESFEGKFYKLSNSFKKNNIGFLLKEISTFKERLVFKILSQFRRAAFLVLTRELIHESLK